MDVGKEVGEVGRVGEGEEVEGTERHCSEIEVEVDICFDGKYVSSANGL